jgi:predicted RNA methylase
MKLSKAQIKAHEQVMELVHSDRALKDAEKEFILDNFHEGATNINSAAGAFFTPRSLARDFSIEVDGGHVIDLCAGIGGLGYAVELKCDSLTCVEINQEYLSIGKRILPNANWIHASVFDADYGMVWDWAISNPPFGAIKEGSFKGKYTGSQFEYKVMEVASRIARLGAFIIPQMSANFRYSGKQHFSEEESDKARKFREQTGIVMGANCGIDTAMYKDDWKGVSPICEIVICEFELQPEENKESDQLDMFAEAA